jgi:hypothetical protein
MICRQKKTKREVRAGISRIFSAASRAFETATSDLLLDSAAVLYGKKMRKITWDFWFLTRTTDLQSNSIARKRI